MGIPAVVKLTMGQDALANGHMLLREISGFLAIALHTGAALAQQPTTFGANLFAPSCRSAEKLTPSGDCRLRRFTEHLRSFRQEKNGALESLAASKDAAFASWSPANLRCFRRLVQRHHRGNSCKEIREMRMVGNKLPITTTDAKSQGPVSVSTSTPQPDQKQHEAQTRAFVIAWFFTVIFYFLEYAVRSSPHDGARHRHDSGHLLLHLFLHEPGRWGGS